ncbi:hypothetical protein QUF80_21050 [Desulfococcaceae bacterium HSG8]|nr:hypothetical protein [Desulfococcaceae bacterium HSG8]
MRKSLTYTTVDMGESLALRLKVKTGKPFEKKKNTAIPGQVVGEETGSVLLRDILI